MATDLLPTRYHHQGGSMGFVELTHTNSEIEVSGWVSETYGSSNVLVYTNPQDLIVDPAFLKNSERDGHEYMNNFDGPALMVKVSGPDFLIPKDAILNQTARLWARFVGRQDLFSRAVGINSQPASLRWCSATAPLHLSERSFQFVYQNKSINALGVEFEDSRVSTFSALWKGVPVVITVAARGYQLDDCKLIISKRSPVEIMSRLTRFEGMVI